MIPRYAYFSIGTSLANLVNVESLLTFDTIYVPRDGRVPLVGSVGKRPNGVLKRDGFKNGKWQTNATQAEYNAFLLSQFGSYTLDSKVLYVSTIDEQGYYSPYLCNFERPSTVDESATPAGNGEYLSPLTFMLMDCILQSATKTTTATLTASERLVYGNTAGGGFTATLCAANAVQPYTVVSIVKSSSVGTLTIARAGSDTINGGTSSLTRTALHARVDLVSDGVSNWFTI